MIIDEAKSYKVKKASQQVINFLNNQVIAPLEKNIKPQVNKLSAETKETINNLNKKKTHFAAEVTAEVAVEIPNIVNKHKNSQNKEAIADELNIVVESTLNRVLTRELRALVNNIHKVSSTFSPDGLGDFKDITIDIEQKKEPLVRP